MGSRAREEYIKQKFMNKDAITKLQFDKFVKLRNSGIINMTDIRRGSSLNTRVRRCI